MFLGLRFQFQFPYLHLIQRLLLPLILLNLKYKLDSWPHK